MRDLEWLLNARCAQRYDLGDEAGPRSVLDFGVDDFTHLSAQSETDRVQLAKSLRQAIAAFEPRLQIRNLRIEPVANNHRAAEIQFEALLIAESVREPVSFRAVVDGNEGIIRVHGR